MSRIEAGAAERRLTACKWQGTLGQLVLGLLSPGDAQCLSCLPWRATCGPASLLRAGSRRTTTHILRPLRHPLPGPAAPRALWLLRRLAGGSDSISSILMLAALPPRLDRRIVPEVLGVDGPGSSAGSSSGEERAASQTGVATACCALQRIRVESDAPSSSSSSISSSSSAAPDAGDEAASRGCMREAGLLLEAAAAGGRLSVILKELMAGGCAWAAWQWAAGARGTQGHGG